MFFARVAPLHPIFHQPTIRHNLASQLDKVDRNFNELLINLCACTAVSLASTAFAPEFVAAGFTGWEQMGRAFNAALRPRRLRAMFLDGGVSVVQVITVMAHPSNLNCVC